MLKFLSRMKEYARILKFIKTVDAGSINAIAEALSTIECRTAIATMGIIPSIVGEIKKNPELSAEIGSHLFIAFEGLTKMFNNDEFKEHFSSHFKRMNEEIGMEKALISSLSKTITTQFEETINKE